MKMGVAYKATPQGAGGNIEAAGLHGIGKPPGFSVAYAEFSILALGNPGPDTFGSVHALLPRTADLPEP
jgi:hypothetical protein